jgi:hypothetical protein
MTIFHGFSNVPACEDETHEGNGIFGDRLTACPDCEAAWQDAADDARFEAFRDERWED